MPHWEVRYLEEKEQLQEGLSGAEPPRLHVLLMFEWGVSGWMADRQEDGWTDRQGEMGGKSECHKADCLSWQIDSVFLLALAASLPLMSASADLSLHSRKLSDPDKWGGNWIRTHSGLSASYTAWTIVLCISVPFLHCLRGSLTGIEWASVMVTHVVTSCSLQIQS